VLRQKWIADTGKIPWMTLRNPSDIKVGDWDEPKTMAGHQATKRTAICCVPNAVGVIRSLINSITVLNEARARMKKKALRTTEWVFVMLR
jgi:hypothetical protein